jgi:hypothetical protein
MVFNILVFQPPNTASHPQVHISYEKSHLTDIILNDSSVDLYLKLAVTVLFFSTLYFCGKKAMEN